MYTERIFGHSSFSSKQTFDMESAKNCVAESAHLFGNGPIALLS